MKLALIIVSSVLALILGLGLTFYIFYRRIASGKINRQKKIVEK